MSEPITITMSMQRWNLGVVRRALLKLGGECGVEVEIQEDKGLMEAVIVARLTGPGDAPLRFASRFEEAVIARSWRARQDRS